VAFGLHDRLPAVRGLDRRELRGAVAHDLREPQENPPAILCRRRAPWTVVEGGARRTHRAVDVGRPGVRRPGNRLRGCRIDRVERAGGLRRDDLAVDVKLIRFHRLETPTIFTCSNRCKVAPPRRGRMTRFAVTAALLLIVSHTAAAQDARATFAVGTASAA